MSKVLKLYNSFTRSTNEVKLGGRLISAGYRAEPINGSFYICGPTVYSDSHLGHAITYTRADLFRRCMKSLFGIDLTTVMNITDVDDKILARTLQEEADDTSVENVTLSSEPSSHPFRRVSEKYHKSFLEDMDFIRVKPPDISVKVTQQIDLIVNYIQRLEQSKSAYIAANGDIYFKVASVANYVGRVDGRRSMDLSDASKQDVRDFVLWKAAKPNEPAWRYRSSTTGREMLGRPGWHVQCSAIASAIFGSKLDFHFGGKDLIFPHHYNEQACCCAFHGLDTSENFHVWTSNWLHSGHLVLRDEKMSKSIGNVVGIRECINNTSVNALRLICIDSHYRSDVNFDDELLQSMKSLDHRIGAFSNYLTDELRRLNESSFPNHESWFSEDTVELGANIQQTQEAIIAGACDDLDLARGLSSILELSKRVYNMGAERLAPRDLTTILHLLTDWCAMCGLEYGPLRGTHDENLVDLVKDFRQTVRLLAADEMKKFKKGDIDSQGTGAVFKTLLESCDTFRSKMSELGYVFRDKKL